MRAPIEAADGLFGREEYGDGPARVWLLAYLGVAVLLAPIIVVRRPDAVTNPQFWAEDSTIFFWQQLTRGFRGALGSYYNNYPVLAQRLIAALGASVPLADAPRVYTTSAIALTALALAAFVLPGFRHLVCSDALRAAWCVAVVSLPVGMEVLSNPTNLGWFLAIWLALLSVMRVPRTWSGVACLAACAAIAVFTTPLAFVTAPVWLLRLWHAARRRSSRELWLSLAVLAALAAVIALTHDLGRRSPEFQLGGDASSVLKEPTFVLDRWCAIVADRVAALVLAPDALAAVRAGGGGPSAAIVALISAVALGACWWGGFATLPAILVAAYFAAGSVLLSMLGRPVLLLLTRESIPVRYTVFPAAMLVLGLLAAVDAIPARRVRIAAAAGVAAVFL